MSYIEIPEISGNVRTIDLEGKNIINQKYFIIYSENNNNYELKINEDKSNMQFTTIFLFNNYSKINKCIVNRKENFPFYLKEEPAKVDSTIKYTKQTIHISIDNNKNINILSSINKYYS